MKTRSYERYNIGTEDKVIIPGAKAVQFNSNRKWGQVGVKFGKTREVVGLFWYEKYDKIKAFDAKAI